MIPEPLAILGAMPEEVSALIPHLHRVRTHRRAGREFHTGTLFGVQTVVVFSRWGKVAAAATTAEVILSHGAGAVVFCGIAGSLRPDVVRGDVVIADSLVHHDLNASPFFAPTEVPLLGVTELPVDADLSRGLADAARRFLASDARDAAGDLWDRAGIDRPRVIRGVIATGDRVIFSDSDRLNVLSRVPAALCVEMEGAAAAQVCHEHGVPYSCVRTISDSADHGGPEHVKPFFEGLAGIYAAGIVRRWLTG
ncbi:MAG: 5'-methylthioadenosine/adenosylhomocysteine nucleosidase [Phycisphaerae bacterium]|nr:5'-methylthioadenosine/adenosylhomocysteine nucleosidase [Phycisphaerae bacterium]